MSIHMYSVYISMWGETLKQSKHINHFKVCVCTKNVSEDE